MKELFISDLDGTLLNSSGDLSKKSIDILNPLIENSLNFTIATARSLDSAIPLIGDLNLKLPLVLYNGVLVYDPLRMENIYENFIPYEDHKLILDCFELEGIEPIVFTLDSANSPSAFYRNISNRHMATYVNSRISSKDKRFKEVINFNKSFSENTITIISIGEKTKLKKLKNTIESHCEIEVHFAEDVYFKGAYWLEFAALSSTKKEGVSFLKNHLEAEHLICFGDNLNDIPMFELANEKYATSNAREELKTIATSVIDSNDSDSVAKFIQARFI